MDQTNVTSSASDAQSFRVPITVLVYTIGYSSLVFGLVGNCLIVALFARRCFVNESTRLMLTLLGCSDTCVLLVSLTRFMALTLYNFDIRLLGLGFCRGQTFLTYVVTDMSSWCLCLVCAERLFSVAAPMSVKRVFQRGHILLAFACLLGVSACKNLPLLLGMQFTPGRCAAANSLEAYYVSDFFLRVGLPVAFVFTANVTVLCRLSLMSSSSSSSSAALNKEFRIFRMLLAVSVYSFVSMVPGRAMFLYTFINPVPESRRQLSDFVYNLLIVFAYTNNAINFYLYLASSASVRALLVAMVTRGRRRVSRNQVASVTMATMRLNS